MFSRKKLDHAGNHRKPNKIAIKGDNSTLKTYQFKIPLPCERQRWKVKEMTGKLPRNRKRMPADPGRSCWDVEQIKFSEQFTKRHASVSEEEACGDKLKLIAKGEGNPPGWEVSTREVKTKRSSQCFSVDDQDPSCEFPGDREHSDITGQFKKCVDNNGAHTEFHHLSGKSYLLILRYPSRLHFRGVLSVTPVIGTTSFLGYEFNPGMKSRLVFSPKGTSPLYLQAVGYSNNGDFENIPKALGVDNSILKRMGLRDSAILLEPAYGEQWERLLGSFSSTLNFNPLIPNTKVKHHVQSEVNVEMDLGVKFVQPGEPVMFSRLHEENSDWRLLSEAVLNEVTDQGLIRIMIFGGKGVGKSTLMRFIVNQWLSSCKRRKKSGIENFSERKALFVDFDPGQSEFMPPGCISATIISEPLLGPNYTHLRDPERMFCIGDLNVERCPNWYLKCADELLKFCYSNSSLCQMPWFINTMGFCRGIGGDLAVKLIQLCHPTHVVQMRSQFSRRNFEPIDLLSWNSVSSWKGMDWNPLTSCQKQTPLKEYSYYHLWSLAERSSVEENILNGVQATPENGARVLPDQNTEEMEDIDSEWGLPAWQCRDLSILAYFSRMVSGPSYSILQPTPHRIKLSDLILSLPSPLLKPQMITTSFNARLVALCNFKNNQETTILPLKDVSGDSQDVSSEPLSKSKQLDWERVLKPSKSEYPKVLFHMPLAPCLGFGIVRAVDRNNHLLFLTTPVKDEVLVSVNCLATSPSIGSLPKEIYFESFRLNPKRKDPIPYTVVCNKKSALSRTIPRVFQVFSKPTPNNKV